MTRSAIRLVILTMFLAAPFAASSPGPALAAGGGGDHRRRRPRRRRTPGRPPPAAPPKKPRRSPPSSPASRTPAFASGYRAAYATIYDRNDYAAAIEQLKALGHDDHANVANLIGYSYRKLGDYRLSQIWYERALKADPNHVLTWQYYGLWQIEQGNRDSGAISSEPDRRDLRHGLRGVPVAGRGARKGAGHRPRVLNSAMQRCGRASGGAPASAWLISMGIDSPAIQIFNALLGPAAARPDRRPRTGRPIRCRSPIRYMPG